MNFVNFNWKSFFSSWFYSIYLAKKERYECFIAEKAGKEVETQISQHSFFLFVSYFIPHIPYCNEIFSAVWLFPK